MQVDRFAAVLMFAAVLTIGLVLGLHLADGEPAYGAMASGAGGYLLDEIDSESESTKQFQYEGRTIAVLTPSGNLKLVRVMWQQKRGDDASYFRNYAEAGGTYQTEIVGSIPVGD
jgi:hypothetical protein